ncbi:hypothetical protein EC2854350_2146 [Escherichia coli 2854350]|nr:hypothetical protein EC2854350_2146 [Escherichia coli 2854350]
MINRIRVVTLLVMVLGVFALLQLISGSLFFSSLHHSQKSFVVSNQLREQQGELTSTWDLMLQTRINLSRSAVRMMMDSSNQQSNAKVELLDSARKTLAQAATHYKKFKSMAPLPEMVATSRNIDEKYKNYYTALTELIDYLDYGNTGAYFAQPTQECKMQWAKRLLSTPSAVKNCIAISSLTTQMITDLPSGNWWLSRWWWY